MKKIPFTDMYFMCLEPLYQLLSTYQIIKPYQFSRSFSQHKDFLYQCQCYMMMSIFHSQMIKHFNPKADHIINLEVWETIEIDVVLPLRD